MALGDLSQWIKNFESVEQKFTAKLVSKWPECRNKLNSRSEEDDITNNLIQILWKDPDVRRLGYIEAQYVPLIPTGNKGAVTATGYIDIALIIDDDRDMYIAYECKRLNVMHKGKRSSLATPYVKEGLYRFLQAQYSQTLPIACMLGYVMDGQVQYALNKVLTSIMIHVDNIKLLEGPHSLNKIESNNRFHTVLLRADNSKIKVSHTLLSF